MRIVFVTNDTRFAYNLRHEVMHEMVRRGHEVFLVSEKMGYEQELEEMGIKLVDIKVDRRGKNPLSDMALFFRYLRVIRQIHPDIVFTNNIKPNVYVGFCCRVLKVQYVTNICGMGTPLEKPGLFQVLTTIMYRIGIKKAKAVFFQNEDNQKFFEMKHILSPKTKRILLPGSGVNLERHQRSEYPMEGKIVFLYAARIMKEKGIEEFLEAARHFRSLRDDVSFEICGMCDDEKYLSLLKKLQKEGIIQYHGLQKDLEPFYQRCSCFLYPSYYPEGMSNVLLEAAACGRPVIATDRCGCRETVDNGITGYCIPIHDSVAVIKTVEAFLQLSPHERAEMGYAGRKKMEREFDRKLVVDKYIKLVAAEI